MKMVLNVTPVGLLPSKGLKHPPFSRALEEVCGTGVKNQRSGLWADHRQWGCYMSPNHSDLDFVIPVVDVA